MHRIPRTIRYWSQLVPPGIFSALLVFFVVFGAWMVLDLQRGYNKVLADTQFNAVQHSQINAQSFRTKVMTSDYVLRDVLGRTSVQDLVIPDVDPIHAKKMAALLKEKGESVPDFFSIVLFDQHCKFTATASGSNIGAQSKKVLCDERKAHRGDGPMASYVPGATAANGRPALVLSRHIWSAAGDFQGGVLGVIELANAQRLFESPTMNADHSVALFDDAQVLLARDPYLATAIEKAVAPKPGGAVIQTDIDGRERIFGFSKVEGFPFTVAYGIDKALATADWRQRAIELVMGYLTLLLLFVLILRAHWTTLRQREVLRASEEHFRMLAENMADIVWRTDAHMRITYINAADERLRGFPRKNVVGTLFKDNLTPQGQVLFDAMLAARETLGTAQTDGMEHKYDLPLRHKNASEVWIEMSSVTVLGHNGGIKGYQGVGRDITARKQHEAELLQSNQQLESQLHAATQEKSALQELSTRDGLTGLYNRRFLDDTLPGALARAGREEQPLAVIMLDLDYFKRVNDQYGHAAGDEVLRALAELLRTGARESDLVCRYGGEEFAAIMPNMNIEQALERAQSWRKALEETTIAYGGSGAIRVTLSAGIAVYPNHGANSDVLLTRADEMLYRSKHEGRNRVTVFS